MYKKNILVGVILGVGLALMGSTLCPAEEITLTTYYPSPSGVYQSLRLHPASSSNISNCNSKTEGLMYYDENDHTIKVCGPNDDGLGYEWQELGSTYWTQENNDLYATDTDWKIGIGDPTPDAKLDVAGNAYVSGPLSVAYHRDGGSELNVCGSNWNAAASFRGDLCENDYKYGIYSSGTYGVYATGVSYGVYGYSSKYGSGDPADFYAGSSGYKFPDRTMQTTSMQEACRLCDSCGGAWNVRTGGFRLGNNQDIHGYGSNCGGDIHNIGKNAELCCKGNK